MLIRAVRLQRLGAVPILLRFRNQGWVCALDRLWKLCSDNILLLGQQGHVYSAECQPVDLSLWYLRQ
jgi:hypothetical protein